MIIASERIGGQDELLKKLHAQGFELTQATLSRDLKQMKVAKIMTNEGSYLYVLPTNPLHKRSTKDKGQDTQPTRNGFVSINFSANIGVIKTSPGYASGIAYDIDNSELPGILATIAGDDTILVVIKEEYKHDDILAQLGNIISM